VSSARSALGSAPATSARPPVFANGAHSDATNRTFSGDAGTRRRWGGWPSVSASVYAIVDVRENIVPRLDIREPLDSCTVVGGGLQLVCPQVVVDLVELNDVLVDAPGGVRNRGPGLHDEGPVGRLRQHQLARRLIDRSGDQWIGAGMATRQLHHPLARDVQVAVGPGVGLVQPVVVVALEAPRRRAR